MEVHEPAPPKVAPPNVVNGHEPAPTDVEVNEPDPTNVAPNVVEVNESAPTDIVEVHQAAPNLADKGLVTLSQLLLNLYPARGDVDYDSY